MKRVLAVYGVLLFLIGMVVVPSLHQLEMEHADAEEAHPCCCDAHHPDEPNSSEPRRNHHPHHDPSTCSICQMAKAPVETATTVIVPYRCESMVIRLEAVRPSRPDLPPICILPFSCGPPA